VSVAAASVDVAAALPELRHVEHEQNEGGGVDSFRSTLPEQNEGGDGFRACTMQNAYPGAKRLNGIDTLCSILCLFS
jgi:hypothetical protein